jgi:hypothetical protein
LKHIPESDKQRDGGYILFTSDAVCIDPEVGKDLIDYIGGDLRGARRKTFALHLLDCEACETDASNFLTVAAMAKNQRSTRGRR